MKFGWRKVRSRGALPNVAGRDPYQYRLFAETFSAYLRQNKARWRLRRTDRFSPLDLDLAQRHIKLDLRIDRRLLNEFLDLYGEDLRIPPGTAREAREVTIFVPVLSHPKRLLLEARQTFNGVPLSGLQRYDESRILARDLLALLYARQPPRSKSAPPPPELDDPRRMAPLRLLMSTLLFTDPHRLKERLSRWCSDRPSERWLIRDAGLADEKTLLDWINQEGDEFLPDMGGELRRELQPFVRQHLLDASRNGDAAKDHVFWIDREHRAGGLAYFPTLELLLLHGIQDLLKMIVETASPRRIERDKPSERAALVAAPAALAERVRATIEETSTLIKLIRNQESDDAFLDFIRHLDRWVSYAVVTVRPSVPFTITFEDVFLLDMPGGEPLSKRERFLRLVWRTKHYYPLPLKDALSVHVEVVSPETEIIAGKCGVIARELNGSLRPAPDLFGQKSDANERLLHRYSSKRPVEGSEIEAERQMSNSIWLDVQYKLLKNVKAAYWAAALTFTAAALFILAVSGWSLYNGRTNSLISDSILSGAVATTLALWLITTQYRNSVVHRKLFLARWTMYVAIAIMIASLGVLGGWRLAHLWNSPCHPTNGASCRHTGQRSRTQ